MPHCFWISWLCALAVAASTGLRSAPAGDALRADEGTDVMGEPNWKIQVLLPIVSSLDNFAVGAALGVSGQLLPLSTQLIIAACNAGGMAASDFAGHALGAALPLIAGWVSGMFFIGIGMVELRSWWREDAGVFDQLAEMSQGSSALALALPMTLNNLIGGMAGGMAGASATTLLVGTFVASLGLMYLGLLLGSGLAKGSLGAGPFIAGVAFLFLGLSELPAATFDLPALHDPVFLRQAGCPHGAREDSIAKSFACFLAAFQSS